MAAQDRPALTNKQEEKNLQNAEQVLYIDSPSKQNDCNTQLRCTGSHLKSNIVT